MKDIITLSIYEYHNASASISKGSKIVAAFQEDRFVRKKNEVGIPIYSIKACLKALNITPQEVDYIGIVNDRNSFKSKNSILNFLYDHCEKLEYQIRYRWNKNDMAFWDNRCTMHRAMWDYHPMERKGRRVTIKGEKPF